MSGQTVIIGGVGEPNRVKVGSNFGIAANAISESLSESVIISGGGYNVATSDIVQTGTTESALFYIKNNEQLPIQITSVFVNTNNSVGSLSGQPILRIYRNSTSGSIIDSKRVITPLNSNFGSFNKLDADIYQGATGENFNDNQGIIKVPLPSRLATSFIEFDSYVVLPNGASFGISYQPESGSTSVDMIVGVTLIKIPRDFS